LKLIQHSAPADAHAEAYLEAHILRALLYFDIFRYPLTQQEILLYLQIPVSHLHDIERSLHALCDKLQVYQFDDLYCLHNDISIIERRRRGNLMAGKIQEKASQRARLIHSFPFVRSVNISGSLSKNYFDKDSDLDFFIITAPKRLWLCRLLLTLYKKIWLLNSRKYFCINYFITTDHLEIPDRNIFTATEIITLKNHTGSSVYYRFMEQNDWVQEYFPNYRETFSKLDDVHHMRFKSFMEYILRSRMGDILDKWARKITKTFLHKKYNHLNRKEFEQRFRTTPSSSKHHPQGFQTKVLDAYSKTCAEFEQKHGINLH